jgi:hypothetical protein
LSSNKEVYNLLVATLKNCEDAVKAISGQLGDLLESDDGELTVDPNITSLRQQEESLRIFLNGLVIEQNLLKQLVSAADWKPTPKKLPKDFVKYVEKQFSNTAYKRNPGLVVQDMFIGLGDDSLPAELSGWIEDNPNEAINTIMNWDVK